MRLTFSALALAAALTLAGCGSDVNIYNPTQPSTTTPIVVKTSISFRVSGNPTQVRIRYSTPVDGLGQVVTSLPYFQTFTISGDSVFLSLEATPISYGYGVLYPFLSIQIAVDNVVFREATSADFILAPLATSGQWRQ